MLVLLGVQGQPESGSGSLRRGLGGLSGGGVDVALDDLEEEAGTEEDGLRPIRPYLEVPDSDRIQGLEGLLPGARAVDSRASGGMPAEVARKVNTGRFATSSVTGSKVRGDGSAARATEIHNARTASTPSMGPE